MKVEKYVSLHIVVVFFLCLLRIVSSDVNIFDTYNDNVLPRLNFPLDKSHKFSNFYQKDSLDFFDNVSEPDFDYTGFMQEFDFSNFFKKINNKPKLDSSNVGTVKPSSDINFNSYGSEKLSKNQHTDELSTIYRHQFSKKSQENNFDASDPFLNYPGYLEYTATTAISVSDQVRSKPKSINYYHRSDDGPIKLNDVNQNDHTTKTTIKTIRSKRKSDFKKKLLKQDQDRKIESGGKDWRRKRRNKRKHRRKQKNREKKKNKLKRFNNHNILKNIKSEKELSSTNRPIIVDTVTKNAILDSKTEENPFEPIWNLTENTSPTPATTPTVGPIYFKPLNQSQSEIFTPSPLYFKPKLPLTSQISSTTNSPQNEDGIFTYYDDDNQNKPLSFARKPRQRRRRRKRRRKQRPRAGTIRRRRKEGLFTTIAKYVGTRHRRMFGGPEKQRNRQKAAIWLPYLAMAIA